MRGVSAHLRRLLFPVCNATSISRNCVNASEVDRLRARVKELEQQVTDLQDDKLVKATSLPLNGVRVLDLSRILAGPYCSMTMADLGAEVIKVERPGEGDDTRKWGPPFVKGESTYYLSVNRNKKSITIDLKHPEGIRIIKELAKKSDVLIENFVPGTTESLGIDYQSMKKVNEKLVYASISGFGSEGPYAQRKGYDVMISALGGLMSITGEPTGPPVKVGVALTDVITGLWAHVAISSALIERNRTGTGKLIELSLLDAQISALVNAGSAYLNAGATGKRWGTAHPSIVPYQAFTVKDGFFVVGANNNNQWVDLCGALNLPQLIDDPRFKSNSDRVKNRVELIGILQDTLKNGTKKEWEDICLKHDLPYCPVNNLEEVFKDPQVVFNQTVQEIEHPTIGTVRLPGAPLFFDKKRPAIISPPPLLGEHTHEILSNILSYAEDDIRSLQQKNVL